MAHSSTDDNAMYYVLLDCGNVTFSLNGANIDTGLESATQQIMESATQQIIRRDLPSDAANPSAIPELSSKKLSSLWPPYGIG